MVEKKISIPLIYHVTGRPETDEDAEGLRLALLRESHLNGNFRGVLASCGYSSVTRNLKGAMGGFLNRVNGLCGLNVSAIIDDSDYLDGVSISLLAGLVENALRGANLAGILSVSGEVSGLTYATLVNINRDLHGEGIGAVCIAGELTGLSLGAYNYAETNGRIAVQVGLINRVADYDPDGAVIQFGGYNTIGNRACLGVNFKGLEKLVKKESKPSA